MPSPSTGHASKSNLRILNYRLASLGGILECGAPRNPVTFFPAYVDQLNCPNLLTLLFISWLMLSLNLGLQLPGGEALGY